MILYQKGISTNISVVEMIFKVLIMRIIIFEAINMYPK